MESVLVSAILVIIASDLTKAIKTIEVRIDHLNATQMRSRIACCQTVTCICQTRLRACLYERVRSSCPEATFKESDFLGGLALSRTQPLLTIETDEHAQSPMLQVQLLYGVTTGHDMELLGHFPIDLSGLPLGPNRDQIGWTNFDLTTMSKISMVLQIKLYCSPTYYGPTCTERCEPVPFRYHCTDDGKRICVGFWRGPMCDSVSPCISYPCLNDGTCVAQGDSYTCLCNPLYTGSDCAMGFEGVKGVCDWREDFFLETSRH
ncbi:hypothetical protein Btru_057495 [Bulinus truncatus]|nr:hypothetical protein Btru_057495 [Bulinus truncatus]